jgi:hypothetical protein
MSFLPAKNLIFLQDTKHNFKLLVNSDASLLILPHSSPAPPTGLHPVGANDKQIPSWGFRRRSVCFSVCLFVLNLIFYWWLSPLPF